MGIDAPVLIGAFRGEILTSTDVDYDAARRVWNGMVDHRPAVIARCSDRDDVAAAIRFAGEHDLEIGVRGGGHSVIGHAVPDGGLMIDLSPMGAVTVDADQRTAMVQGGALLGRLDQATQEYGLATTAGNVSHTGVGGLTLGGGMGWLARRLGLACDNVTAYEVVAADGSVLRATATDNADLFWGLRGGGGNFGVVTEFTFRIHPVGTTALTAELLFRGDEAAPVLRGWADLLADLPRQATLTADVFTGDPAYATPPDLDGRPVLDVGYVWVGDIDTGRDWLPILRALGKPAAEMVTESTYVALQSAADSSMAHGLRRYWKGHYLRELSDSAIDAFLARGRGDGDGDGDGEAPMLLPNGNLQTYGGAISDVPDDDAAFSQRDAKFEFITTAKWTDPAEDGVRLDRARRYGRAIEPFASGVYVNALADEGQTGVERAYRSAKLDRLTALKRRYDPDNVFHLNHNIRP
jgi:FAD/FMN-containing dehydrogenase